MTEKQWKVIVRVLLFGSIMAALKLIFFDYTMDEEYQMMMGYRLLQGDHLFKEMWEPHQTSAFLCAGLMWLYKTVTGTYTGILIFLRICTTVIQVGISFYLYKVLGRLIQKEYAFLCGLIYFNIVPKIIQIPEFSNMQLWFFTLMVLLLMQYYLSEESRRGKNWYFLVGAGISMALEVLAYPSCLILFPYFVGVILVASKKNRLRDCALFAGTCAVCAVIWLGLVLQNVDLAEFLQNVRYTLNFDLTHDVSGVTDAKLEGILQNILGGIGLVLLSMVISLPIVFFVKKKVTDWSKEKGLLIFLTIVIFVSEWVQMYYWVVLKSGYEVYQIHLFVILLAGFAARKYAGEEKRYLSAGMVGTLLSYIAVIYISDLEMFYALPHGVLGVLFCVIVLLFALQKVLGESGKKWSYFLLISLCLVSIFGKGYTLRAGRNYNVILDTENIMKHGPAIGILSDYMNCYIYNCNYEDFDLYVKEDDTVLIVTNMVTSAGTTPYMFEEVGVAHYSIVDPTSYDEKLLTYWELYPQKEPDVIVVDCWYGQLQEDPDNWIMQYIENEFGYSQVNDGRYVRFYRK